MQRRRTLASKILADIHCQVVQPDVLLGHHHSVQRDAKSNQEVHVFAIAGPPVFPTGDEANAYDFNIEIPLGPVTFIVSTDEVIFESCVLIPQPTT